MIKTFKRTILAAGLVCTMCMSSVTFGTTPGTDIIKAAENTAVLSNPVVDKSGVTTWDTVYFGKYWQNDTDCNGKADKKDTASKAAKTGDASTALPYMLLMLASGSAVVILKKKKEQ